MDKLNDEVRLLILSDHGFCGVEKEVQLNVWLESENLLKFDSGLERKIQNYARESVCYSLIPGRIYINLEGREQNGTVKKQEYENIRGAIKKKLQDLRDPATGKKIIDRILFREEIYRGDYLDQGPDIIAHPVNGYDLKGNLDTDEIFATTPLNGMHSYDDAFICSSDVDLSSVQSIEDVKSVIETLFT
jgi:predicted AlkP superfamily phosphohydrolase/phosphomutase